jgi:serine/threonine protein kinase
MSVDSPSSPPSDRTPDPRPGAEFGRYRLLQRIGSGGMAEIFRAVAVGAQGFERTVAIKRIREEVAELADIGKLFADEARVSALLNHPNIVQVFDFGAVDGMYYIAMEYLKGRNLEQVLSALRQRGQRLAPSLAVLIARDVARGLAYAHDLADEHGRPLSIVHRDVSPANIMLSQMGAIKLLDFGIARITSELRLAVTRGRALRGKCPYLAPEQITNEGEPDGRADIFALGAVLWEMLTGRRLFVGSSDFEVLASVLNRDIPPPSRLVPELPPALDEIVLRALARNPAQRYLSADALAVALDEAMHLLPSRYGDLSALLSQLPLHPTEELRVPVAPPPAAGPRFELVLPTSPTPGMVAPPGDPTRLDLSIHRDEETKRVNETELLAQLSGKPGRKGRRKGHKRPETKLGLAAQAPKLLIGLALGAVLLLGGLTVTRQAPTAPSAPRPVSAASPPVRAPAAPPAAAAVQITVPSKRASARKGRPGRSKAQTTTRPTLVVR